MMSSDPTEEQRAALITTATRASASLGLSVADKPDEQPIETNVVTLRSLGQVIEELATETRRCAGVECFGRSHDGVKLWVTRDWADAQAKRADRYRAALLEIVAAGAAGNDAFAMLIDWPSVAGQMADVARIALAEADLP